MTRPPHGRRGGRFPPGRRGGGGDGGSRVRVPRRPRPSSGAAPPPATASCVPAKPAGSSVDGPALTCLDHPGAETGHGSGPAPPADGVGEPAAATTSGTGFERPRSWTTVWPVPGDVGRWCARLLPALLRRQGKLCRLSAHGGRGPECLVGPTPSTRTGGAPPAARPVKCGATNRRRRVGATPHLSGGRSELAFSEAPPSLSEISCSSSASERGRYCRVQVYPVRRIVEGSLRGEFGAVLCHPFMRSLPVRPA